jgi:hypothetical protein
LLNCIDKNNGQASKWDLIKILGNESQFRNWVKGFLIKDKFIAKKQECNHVFYVKTATGELLHKLLKNGDVVRAFLRLSGRRLKRS